ncbi:paired immunoglobulin-like type 2 receptor alpha [Pteropus vampyrus]|uniref:paired immunoglobulin-like type 2 receptor alpha n=1 Tax=Pteropus vampyrus TaxID=132908 RepID=UPI0005BDE2F3|nr:paired immunoglobulin-like type 2 receptor alpha [Pteropus vampyrus]
MGLFLLLPLLLPASLQADSSAKCNSKFPHEVNQPEHLSASEGDSIHIPFSFCYPWELARDPKVNILWRWKNFHGEFIYNLSMHFIHKDFENRIFLNWKRGWRNGSLQISKLRREDECTYFCRVQLTTQERRREVWQSINGTKLTITRGQQSDPKLDSKDDGILYASLALSSLTSPSAPSCYPSHDSPHKETLYSILKT